MGKGCRSRGRGSLGMSASGSTFTCDRTASINSLPRPLPYAQALPVTHPHLALPRAQVKVQAALKTFMDEATVGRHGPQAWEGSGQEIQLPLVWLLLLPCQALQRPT